MAVATKRGRTVSSDTVARRLAKEWRGSGMVPRFARGRGHVVSLERDGDRGGVWITDSVVARWFLPEDPRVAVLEDIIPTEFRAAALRGSWRVMLSGGATPRVFDWFYDNRPIASLLEQFGTRAVVPVARWETVPSGDDDGPAIVHAVDGFDRHVPFATQYVDRFADLETEWFVAGSHVPATVYLADGSEYDGDLVGIVMPRRDPSLERWTA